jgi:putative zinc finger/helix-turn-helix YgiT family protein
MKGICPNCEKTRELEAVTADEEIKVRGETFTVRVSYMKCRTCGETFEDPTSPQDPLDKAYREYRQRRGMLQPEEMRDLRERYGLTQGDMGKILGWGAVTLSRYENGALQAEAHEKAFRLAMEPRNLLRLLEETPEGGVAEDKKARIVRDLKALEEEACTLERIFTDRFGRYEPDGFSGYRKLDLEKLFSAILYFCKGGVLKTKLNKLLFYADFKHFKEYAVSITGVRYARLPFGPVPDRYEYYYAALIHEEKAIGVNEVIYLDGHCGEEFSAEREPNLSLFSDSELKILATVKEFFQDFNAKTISEFSHEERGYCETPTGKLISYEFSEELKV